MCTVQVYDRRTARSLLDDDQQTLRYVATHGLPGSFRRDKTIRPDPGSLARRVLDGEKVGTVIHT